MTNKYQNGKIYKITDIEYKRSYFGSTVQPLSTRMAKHRNHYKMYLNDTYCRLSSFDLFDEFGVDNCKIELVENFSCNSKEELNAREGYHIRTTTCVNKQVAGRSDEQYRVEHKQQIRDYRQNNKERINELKVIYYHEHSEKLKEPILCECGLYIFLCQV